MSANGRRERPTLGRSTALPDPSEPTTGQLLDAALSALAPTIAEQVAALLFERVAEHVGARSPWLSVAEAAEYLRCSPKRIYDLTGQSRLPAHKDGSRLLLRRDELDAYLNAAATPLPPARDSALRAGSRHEVRTENPGVAGA
jgi:excisionase family DNA binding protein